MVRESFNSVIPNLGMILVPITFFFAISCVVAWYYYGETAFKYVTRGRFVALYKIIFFAACFFGGIVNFDIIVKFLDVALFAIVIPHLIAVLLLASVIKKGLKDYEKVRSHAK
jgi:AGCS family alanine or glycine:cation symporter